MMSSRIACGVAALDCGQRRDAVAGEVDLEALLREDRAEQLEILGLIVDGEDARRGHPRVTRQRHAL